MLDQVIGEFDDGFLSDADTVRSKRKDPRGQFGFNDKKYGTQPKHGYNYNFLYCGVKLFFADISINTVCNAKG